MANQHSGEGSGGSNVPIDGTDSTVQLNIKTLESQIYSFQVDRDMLVSSFKEKIANDIGVPVGQQRLIFRGKVLKDDHPLSEYHVENGHTLHLVARQPAQSQDSSSTSASEATGNMSHRVNDSGSGAPRGRVGQISHSVVLGTFNVGDQGESGVPDISRVIGAVLNSIGVGNQTMANVTGGIPSTNMPSNPGTSPLGNGAEGTHGTAGSQSQSGTQAQPGQALPFQSLSQALQIPLAAAAVPIPTLNTPIPSSLTTISEFINRMEQTLSQNGDRSNTSPNSTADVPRVELPANSQGLHTPEALSIVLHQAERLLSGHAVASLSHIAGRLAQEHESTDPVIRGQIQTESMRVGLAVQQLGALLLELGRTILTLRMGQTPVQSVVNSGPAVYISSSGPNPIMVQPFPLQTSSLSGSVPSINPISLGSVGVAGAPRNVNIHIHAGTSIAPMVTAVGTRAGNGEGLQGDRASGTGSADSNASRVLPVGHIVASAVPTGSSGVATSNPVQQPLANTRLHADNTVRSGQAQSDIQNRPIPSVSRDVETDHRIASSVTVNGEGGSGVSLDVYTPQESGKDTQVGSSSEGNLTCSDKDSENSSLKKPDTNEDAKAVPFGLGLGGLERKKRVKQQKPPAQSGEVGTTSIPSNQNQQTRSIQQVRNSGPSGGHGPAGEGDMASVMSQVLDSPALNGLLSGVSGQTGLGSPDALRNMLQQFTQNPQMRNVVNQIAEQVDSEGVENMFTGMGGQGGGGGLDLSRMFQQMMPIVTRALGAAGPNRPQPFSVAQPQSLPRPSGFENHERSSQNESQSVVQLVEGMEAPEDVFRALVENSFQLSGGESGPDGLVNELCSDEGLVKEYVDLLQSEINRRFQGESGQGR